MDRSADWLAQADNDLAWARHSADGGFHAQACFAAQQAAEKAIRGLILAHHDVSRGHSLLHLLGKLPLSMEVDEELSMCAAELDQYYIPTRYPNGFAAGSPFEYFSTSLSKKAIVHAQRIIDFCRGGIP